MEQGLFATKVPEEVGGGLDYLSVTLMDRELGKATWGMMGWSGGPRSSRTPFRASSGGHLCFR